MSFTVHLQQLGIKRFTFIPLSYFLLAFQNMKKGSHLWKPYSYWWAVRESNLRQTD